MYDATLGRFLSRDPLGTSLLPQTNLYVGMGNNTLVSSDPFGLATKQQCEAAIKGVQRTRWYKALEAQFKAAKCKMPPITCDEKAADVLEKEGGVGAYYKHDNGGSVHIVYPARNVEELARAIVHELIHAFDDCKGLYKVNADKRLLSACTELRAYLFSGQCSKPVKKGGYLLKGETTGQCLLRKAQDSIRALVEKEKNPQFGTEEYVCCAWQHCVCEKNLPGSGFFRVKKPALPTMPKSCEDSLPHCKLFLGLDDKGGGNLADWFK